MTTMILKLKDIIFNRADSAIIDSSEERNYYFEEGTNVEVLSSAAATIPLQIIGL